MNITDKKVEEYIEGLYRPLNPFLEELRRLAEAEAIPIILKDTESFLLTLIEMVKPKQILEIGTAVGYSALCFAMCNKEVEVTSLEINDRMIIKAASNIERAGLKDRIKIKKGDAVDSLNTLIEQLNAGKISPFDFIFLDGAKGHYLEIWKKCMNLCHSGTVIVSDNILFKAMTASDEYLDIRRNKTIVNRMRMFLKHITSLSNVSSAVLPVGDGVAVSVIKEVI